MSETGRRICVVGAGCSGLASVKALADAGLEFDCFEDNEVELYGRAVDLDNPGLYFIGLIQPLRPFATRSVRRSG